MPLKVGGWEQSERDLQQLAESRREPDELFERKKRTGFKNGAEMLQAFRDLFDSDEEMEEFGRYIQRMREEERARYRD
jgi:predicted Rdx family selenoprotein